MTGTETLGSFTLRQREDLPKVSRDSLLLASFATLRKGWRVFDLGCGVGVLALALARREEGLTLDGMDLQAECAGLARQNLKDNGLTGTIRQGDVADPPVLDWGSYDLVISNPPYFFASAGKTAPGPRGIARTGDGLDSWCSLAGRLLRNGGRFALCTRPAGLNALFHALTAAGLEPKRLQCVQSAGDRGANLVLVEALRQGRPGLEMAPVLIVR